MACALWVLGEVECPLMEYTGIAILQLEHNRGRYIDLKFLPAVQSLGLYFKSPSRILRKEKGHIT